MVFKCYLGVCLILKFKIGFVYIRLFLIGVD